MSCFLLSGSRSGAIHHHDVRVAEHQVGTLLGHTQEVCGLKWSPDGKFLASGGNDNLLNIWNAQPGSPLTNTTPLHTFSQHQAAVKVIFFFSLMASIICVFKLLDEWYLLHLFLNDTTGGKNVQLYLKNTFL